LHIWISRGGSLIVLMPGDPVTERNNPAGQPAAVAGQGKAGREKSREEKRGQKERRREEEEKSRARPCGDLRWRICRADSR
jgi:hypothetical protein